ncbi:MAG: hypothetical protein CMH32_00560 [Micavibrio sp.]|nr:hypothetical protein [Micavibrio sp.]HCK32220.1 hypothetical protein [Rhodospirillaceae bacterium]
MTSGEADNNGGKKHDVRVLFNAGFMARMKRLYSFYNLAFQKHQPLYGEAATILDEDTTNSDMNKFDDPKTQDRIYQAYTQFYETSGSMLIFCGFMLLQPQKDELVDLMDPEKTGDLDMFRTNELVLKRMADIIDETIKWRGALYNKLSDEKKIEHMEDGRYCLGTYQEASPVAEITSAEQYYYQMEEAIFETFGLLIEDLPYDRQAMKKQYKSKLPDEEGMLGVRAIRAAMIRTGLIQNYFPGSYHDEHERAKEEFPNIDEQATRILEERGLMTDHNVTGLLPDNIINFKNDK